MQKPLEGGLILRSLSEGHASDAEQLPQFYSDVFGGMGDPFAYMVGHWTNDLIEGHNPEVTPEDIWVVVDPAHGEQVISATLLLSHVWRYEDVQLSVGRPELVATHPDYRRRGLVRALFDVAHERSAALGQNVQAITGIPHFYRQFGYTMAVDLGSGAVLPLGAVPKLAEDEQPRFTFRAATLDDIPQMMAWEAYDSRRSLLSTVHSAEFWRYQLQGRHEQAMWATRYFIIVDGEGNDVGYIAPRAGNFGAPVYFMAYVVGERSSYLETFNDVMRFLKAEARPSKDEQPGYILFDSGSHETVFTLVDHTFPGQRRQRLYAWYLRVDNLIRLIQDIKPVLECRLEGSGAHRYSGELRIGFFERNGLLLKFERGCLVSSQEVPMERGWDIAFPWDTFLNVVFGYRSADDMHHILPEVGANSKAAALLEILFPRKRSALSPLA